MEDDLLPAVDDKTPFDRLFARHWRDWPREWVHWTGRAASGWAPGSIRSGLLPFDPARASRVELQALPSDETSMFVELNGIEPSAS
jgi:hypothetical protein